MQSVQGKPDNVSDNGNNETDTVKKKKSKKVDIIVDKK